MNGLFWEDGCFWENGQAAFLISGEFPYFRVPKADWRARLKLWKQAGGNTVSTYIPWLIHEAEEGTFCFGEHDYDDLDGFLYLCREEGLGVIIRPGPYQYSELVRHGLPVWLAKNYPGLLAADIGGRAFSDGSVSYMHPLFLQKAKRWMEAVCRQLLPWCTEKDGPVIALQLDNEATGIHVWFNDGWYDYNPCTFGFGREDGRFARFLKEKYRTPACLSKAWEVPLDSFAAALPICRSARTFGEIRRLKDYEDCYLEQVADYFAALTGWVRDCGIFLPLLHNSPNPESNALFFDAAGRLGPSFLLGSDHYYNLNQTWQQNNPTPQYAVRCFASLSLLKNLGMPPTVLELPSGTQSDWPPFAAADAKACYLSNLAFGMKGWNYYIFTGGPNVPGTGRMHEIYDYHAPIGADGAVRPLYRVQKEVHGLCEKLSLAGCRLIPDFYVGYDGPMLRGKSYRGDPADVSCPPDNSRDRLQEACCPPGGSGDPDTSFLAPGDAWETTLKGPVTTALCAGLLPGFFDLEQGCPPADKPLVLVSSSVLSGRAQKNLAAFLKKGGRLLYGPAVPSLNEDLTPCRIFADAAGASQSCRREAFSIHIQDSQCRRLLSLLSQYGVHPRIEKSEYRTFAVLQEDADHGILFLMNLFSSPAVTDVTVTRNHIRYGKKRILLHPMEVKLFLLQGGTLYDTESVSAPEAFAGI